MLIIAAILSVPAIYLLVRIFLILNDNLWERTKCKIVSFDIVKKDYSSFGEDLDSALNKYIKILYSYDVNRKTYKSKRLSLGLIDRGYSNVEVEHDPFLKSLKDNNCTIEYLKIYPCFSVMRRTYYDSASNLVLLLLYIVVIISSYLIIEWIS